MKTHCATSSTVRPQPRQTSSNVVEQTATQGVSGRSGAGDKDEGDRDVEDIDRI
jgi:hypothetical protein